MGERAMRRRWIYKNGDVYEACEEQAPEVHHIMGDIKEYQSMADGSMITSRSQHREHLKRHGLQEVGNETKYLQPRADLRKTGVKEALIDSVQRAKEQHGSRFVERAITEQLQKAYEVRNRR